MKRRDFLKLCMHVPVIELVAGDYTKDSNTEFSKEQLFVYSNTRLNRKFNSKGYCYIIVHPGYANYRYEERLIKDLLKNLEKYGDYAQYLGNISKLIGYLNNSDELAIFAIESRDFHDEKIPKKELRPNNSAMIIVTEDRSNIFEKYVGIENEYIQSPELMFSFLKRNDVKEARFAGEWAWWAYDGCISRIAKNFYENDFDVKGIKGCIYPTVPKRFNETVEKLYNEQVPLDSILKRTLD